MSGLILLLANCQPSSEEPQLVFSHPPFENLLNIKGTPDSASDRSVFMFSDLGAWHGYALPEKKYAGSFTGPFIMTQDNGIWLSECFAHLRISDAKTSRKIDLSEAKVIESKALPNKLLQVLEVQNPDFLITSELFFISNRTAMIQVTIENKSELEKLKLKTEWKGQSFLEDLKFGALNANISFGFGKNNNIALFQTSRDLGAIYHAYRDSFIIDHSPISVRAGAKQSFQLTQTFCFSETELNVEKSLVDSLFAPGKFAIIDNSLEWNEKIDKLLRQIHPKFNDPAHKRIAIKCLQTLNNNWRSAAGFLKHDGLFPSYNYEWFNGFWSWDSWKHAVAIAKYDTKLAQDQIWAMYDFQDEMGMIADCVYRDTIIENHNWRDTKPPLSAWSIWKVYEASEDLNFLKNIFPKLEKYHSWWYAYRDIDQNGLCEYGSTDNSLKAAKWESGMDNAVRFDNTKMIKNKKVGGSMNRESVDLNAYLFAEKNYLARIAAQLGAKDKAQAYRQEAEKIKAAVQQLCYDEQSGWFYDIDVETKEQMRAFGAEGWIPLWAELATPAQAARVKQTMMDTSKFATYIPFPTLAADHPDFNPVESYWRGPVWLDQAYFAIKGLKHYGYEAEAQRFAQQLFDRLEGLKNDDGPIRENYNPHTGEGYESKHFSWSAAHLLLLLTDD